MMRKVEIPFIYSANTGEWLNICGLTYDDKETIVKVDVWDGDGVTTYEEGEFVLDEENIASLHQKNVDELKNLQQGLRNFTDRCKNLKEFTLTQLLSLYGNIAILIDKSMGNYAMEIAYPAQDLQSLINAELKKRTKEGEK